MDVVKEIWYIYRHRLDIPLHIVILYYYHRSTHFNLLFQSQDSASRPTKLVSLVTRVKQQGEEESYQPPAEPQPRPTSDGIMYQNENFNERRIEYEDILLSERTDSQYSQSESYMSER